MKRAGDIILGAAMCLVALAIQGFALTLMVGLPAVVALDSVGLLPSHREWQIQWAVVVVVGLTYNWISFQRFKREPDDLRPTLSTRVSSLLPRGIWRIIHGRETYFAAEQETRGFDVVLPAEKV